MLGHSVHLEWARPAKYQIPLATRFGEVLEGLRVELNAQIHLTGAWWSLTTRHGRRQHCPVPVFENELSGEIPSG